jgi:RimJ/RimL family protein N-acetyltransferase
VVSANVVTKQLSSVDRAAILRHLHRLSEEDLRLRFGSPQSDASIAHYVERIDFERDSLLGVYGDDLELIGVTHLGMGEEAEFGVSVLPSHRGRGIGTALFVRAQEHARNHMVRKFYVHCLTENKAMLAIARKAKMQIVTEAGEADLYLRLPLADYASVTDEFLEERVAVFDYALKSQVKMLRTIAEAFLPPQTEAGQKP